MRSLLKPALLASLLCFALGWTWGFWSEGRRKLAMTKSPPLRVLCAENWLSDATLKKFSADRSVSIQLWTYANPGEFLRQMANADGKVDVICTSSLLLKSLVASRWVKKMPFKELPNSQHISVDFLHLPYDGNSDYSIPIFWNLYGFFGKGKNKDLALNQTLKAQKVSVWGDDLNILNLAIKSGIRIEERLQDTEVKSLETDIRKFLSSLSGVVPTSPLTISAEALTSSADWVHMPLALVSRLLGETSPYQFWLPTDGGTVDVALFTIGDKSERPEVAFDLINELISSDEALAIHKRVQSGVVHTSLNNLNSVAPLQRAEALRRFPLTRYNFPNLSVDAIPRFQKMFADSKSSHGNE